MKKTLALVLALVMVFGLMAFPASADFTDTSDIEYTQAVDVMAACGFINGFEDGSFDPAGNLTREQAAKVIAYMLLGEDVADAMVATSAPFTDVAATRWSAGYVAYCANSGIVAGRDGKTFDPTGTVTGYEFAKMLLVALGYNSATEGYTGSAWAINVAKTALAIDLFDGNDGANYNAPLTREEAALYAFNTLTATMVEYDSTGTNIDLGNGIIITTGASKATDVVNNKTSYKDVDASAIDDDEFSGTMQFCEKYVKDLVLLDKDYDAFGRPCVAWEFDSEDVGTYADAADLTYTAAVKPSAIYTATSKEATTATYIIDGTAQDTLTLSGNDTKIGGNGTLTEVYYGSDKVTVIQVNTYVATIKTWVEADEDNDVDESVTIDPLTDSKAAAALKDGVFETTVFTEDDADDDTVVLYTAASTDGTNYVVKSVVAADSTTAEIDQTTGTSSFVADGTTYKYSANKEATVSSTTVDDGNNYDIYLDSYGYVIYTTAAEDSTTNYAYIAKLGSDKDIYGSMTYYAKLVFADGTTASVETDKDYSADTSLLNYVVTYKVNSDDEYVLTDVSDAAAAVNADFALTKGKTNIQVVAADTVSDPATPAEYIYANSKTIFVVADTSGSSTTYDVYTGIANVPSMENAKVVYAIDGTYAAYVYIQDATNSATTSDDTIVILKDKTDFADEVTIKDTNTYVVLPAIIKGVIDTVKVEVDSAAYDALDSITDDTIIIVKSITEKDGLVVTLGTEVVPTVALGTSTYANDVIKLGGTPYSVADDVAVFYVDDGAFSAAEIGDVSKDATDSAVFTLDDDGFVSALYIFVDTDLVH